MRALTRMRLLAAMCALLMTFGSISRAGVSGRPVDRPEGPPEPVPVQVGDPDEPHFGGMLILGGHSVAWVIRLPGGGQKFPARFVSAGAGNRSGRIVLPRGGRRAR